jgi:hypothetical protein
MMRRLALLLVFCLACMAQKSLSVEELIAFVKSSVEQKMTDAEVSRYLRTVKLNGRLSDAQLEDLLTSGLGPRSLQALHAIHDQSQPLNLPAVPPLTAVAAKLPPEPAAEEQRAIIAEVREYALNYSKSLPNFLCTQHIYRKSSPAAPAPLTFQEQDRLTVRLTYFEQKEDYHLLAVNDAPTTRSYQELGGTTSTGEFGSMLRQVFEPASHARFEWSGWARLRNQIVMSFHYAVDQPRSHWELDYLRREHLIPGYSGHVFLDKDTHVVLRLTLRADGIPETFSIRSAETILDYDYQDISGHPFLLPSKAQVDLSADGTLTRNETDFRRYQKYTADAAITYDLAVDCTDPKNASDPACKK